MHSAEAQGKGDISTLPGRRHFYFALTHRRSILQIANGCTTIHRPDDFIIRPVILEPCLCWIPVAHQAEPRGFRLQLTFWGVRGSTPTPREDCLGFGGNTSCIEILSPEHRFVLDAGSGIRELGDQLACQSNLRIDVLLTHFHWDHIQGLPFFAPLFKEDAQVSFYTEKPLPAIKETLEGQMARPYFPVPFEAVAASREYHDLQGERIAAGEVRVHSFPLNHPQGACGYRIDSEGASIVHVSDHEHGNAGIDRGIRDHASGADVLIYDAQYTPEEYGTKRGWGHSTYKEAVSVARDAGVKQLILFHHDPRHNDEFMLGLLQQAQQHFENTQLAQEGWTIRL
jgi:phosphoribosyl 1,2-cyclic phosphodiesterase